MAHSSLVDLTGQHFGKLTVIKRADDSVTNLERSWLHGFANVIVVKSV